MEVSLTIKTEQLKSTALASATYDDETKDLDVTFTSGNTYTHRNVPVEIWEGLVGASSPGRYWHSSLKDQY
jgi:KTSC domain